MSALEIDRWGTLTLAVATGSSVQVSRGDYELKLVNYPPGREHIEVKAVATLTGGLGAAPYYFTVRVYFDGTMEASSGW